MCVCVSRCLRVLCSQGKEERDVIDGLSVSRCRWDGEADGFSHSRSCVPLTRLSPAFSSSCQAFQSIMRRVPLPPLRLTSRADTRVNTKWFMLIWRKENFIFLPVIRGRRNARQSCALCMCVCVAVCACAWGESVSEGCRVHERENEEEQL